MNTILKILLVTGGVVAAGYYLNKKGYIKIGSNGKVELPINPLPVELKTKPRIPEKPVQSTPAPHPGGSNPTVSTPTTRAL
jgi:hypothetical protein